MLPIKNILVPIDFSNCSNEVFEMAHSLAQYNNARIHLIHVIDPIYYKEPITQASDLTFIHKIRFENAKEELTKFKFELPFSQMDIVEALIEGTPHNEIIKYAKKNDIDLIIIGSHGWTNLSHNLMGSIAERIMRQADIPVICFKSNVPVIKNRGLRRQIFAENWVG